MGYLARTESQLNGFARTLSRHGILGVPDVYSVAELATINSAMDPIFARKSGEARSYVRSDEMLDAGILNTVLSAKMRQVLFSLVPNAVLYHFHAYEIAGNSSRSHIFSESLSGWHRDPDSEFFIGDPTHISVFVYLKAVSEEDGPFEFSPHHPNQSLKGDSPVISMTGPSGMSFVWHRSYYHRASPNRGPRRRRLLKLSIQPNEFQSVHLKSEFFARTCKELPIGNYELDLLFGRYQGKTANSVEIPSFPRFFVIQPNDTIKASVSELNRLRDKESQGIGATVAYD